MKMDSSSGNETADLSLSLISTTTKSNKNTMTSLITSAELDDHLSPCLTLAPNYSMKKKKSGCMKTTASFNEEDEDGKPRKKLRLTKHQSHVLEQSFKDHSILNPNQKEALAEKLNLRPRQVEVWFQNRRARTKLKQTEMEYEELKRQCEKLTEDNNKLKKELHELKNIQLIRLFMD